MTSGALARARAEQETLSQEIASGTGLHGGLRRAASHRERAQSQRDPADQIGDRRDTKSEPCARLAISPTASLPVAPAGMRLPTGLNGNCELDEVLPVPRRPRFIPTHLFVRSERLFLPDLRPKGREQARALPKGGRFMTNSYAFLGSQRDKAKRARNVIDDAVDNRRQGKMQCVQCSKWRSRRLSRWS